MIVRAKSTERSRSMWYYIGSPSRFSSGSHSFTVSFQLNFGFQIALIAKIPSTLYFWQINVVLFAILFHGTTTTFASPSSSANGRFLNLINACTKAKTLRRLLVCLHTWPAPHTQQRLRVGFGLTPTTGKMIGCKVIY